MSKKKSKVHQALADTEALFADAQHGAFVGRAPDGRVFVGFITNNKACYRFPARTFDEAVERARGWRSVNAARYEAMAKLERPYVRRPAPELTEDEKALNRARAAGGTYVAPGLGEGDE